MFRMNEFTGWVICIVAFFAFMAVAAWQDTTSKTEIEKARLQAVTSCYQAGGQNCEKINVR